MNDNYIDTLTKEEKSLYDSWSKESVYKAYISEHRTRTNLNEELNKTRRQLIEIKWKLKDISETL